MDFSSSSRHELHDLLTTYYIPNGSNNDHSVETARAGSSMMATQKHTDPDTIVENVEQEDVVLENTNPLHGSDETPKLIGKPRDSILRVRDEAVKVLRNLQMTPSESLRGVRYDYFKQRWFHTTRNSEMELVKHVLLNPNHRPCFFSMQCRMLESEDVEELILKSLLPEPRETGQCLARFAIKPVTDMPFSVLYEMLERLAAEHDGFQVTDTVIIATHTEKQGNRTITNRMKTTDCKAYSMLEPELDDQGSLMVSRASLTCSIKGKRHVQVQISYANNASCKAGSGRNRHIELEQTVKCTNRRVVIQEERNATIEFDVEDEMTSLSDGVPHVWDLVEYLQTPVSDEE